MIEQKNSVGSAPPTQKKNEKADLTISEKNATKHQEQAIDIKQLLLHIELLGYTKQAKIFDQVLYLRGFLPSTHPNKSSDKGRKATIKNINQLTETVSDWQSQVRGCYVVVNGGHSDKEIQSGRAIFYEHDNLSKDIQRDLWQSLNLPEPTFQVDTGGKSIHSYWVFRCPITVEEWRRLQTDLLEYADADRSLKNPSRVMRLAGCVHAETGKQATIISQSRRTYTLSHLRELIPFPQKSTTTPTIPLPTRDVPLYQCLSKSDRALIDGGQISPGRNMAGAKLSRNLIGTATRLNHLGHRYDGHPRTLFDNFCAHCSPPLDDREADAIWKSAEKDNPTATLTDDALENCVKAWQRQSNNQPPKTNIHSANTSPVPKHLEPVDVSQAVINALNKLVDQDLPKSHIEIKLPEIADNFGRSTADVRRTYFALVRERQGMEERIEMGQQIPHLLKAQQSRLKPRELFWGDGGKFADLLAKVADAMPTSVENLITTLIPVAGSRMGSAARIVVKPGAKFTQPAIFWSCIVAPTGRLKTPAQEVILGPLTKLEAEEYKWWKLAQDDFEQALKSYKKNSDSEPPTPPPPRQRFIVQGTTTETRIKIHAENPRGLLNYRDEWSSFINGRNKYRNGKGDDLEIDLSEFNGGSILKDTSSESLFLKQSAISRTGNTQPETLSKFLGQQSFSDYTGEFARWLFCLVPGEVAYIDLFKDDDDAGQRLEESLTTLYRQIGRLPEKDYFLTDGAKGVLQSYHRWLTDEQIAETHPGLRAVYPKIQSYFARLGLWLHIVNAVLAGQEPEQMISGATMYSACALTNFYLNQAKVLYNANCQNELTGELLKIKEFIDKRDGVAIREIRSGIYSLRKKPATEVESLCSAIQELGLIILREGKYYSSPKTSSNIITSPRILSGQGFEGDDQTSSNIITALKSEAKTLVQQGDDGDDQTSSPIITHQAIAQTELDTAQGIEDKSDDGDDGLMMIDHHPQQQSPQGDQGFDDGDDEISEKSEIKNSENNANSELENQAQQRLQAIEQQFLRGNWVRHGENLAQVTGHSDGILILDGGDKSQLFGSYPASKCQALTHVEMLSLGLDRKLTGIDITRTPFFAEGQYYYSGEFRGRVKIIQIVEEGEFFKKPEALVKPSEGTPQRVRLQDLRACYDSPSANYPLGDVVIVCDGYKNKQPVARKGVVEKQDHLWIWVKFPTKNGRFTEPQRFFAHRVVED